MTFSKVDSIPGKATKLGIPKGEYHNLKSDLLKFIESDVEIVRVDFMPGEYKNSTVCRQALTHAIKNHELTDIVVVQRCGQLYLVKHKKA